MSDKGIDLLKKLEGCRLIAYRDGGGVWTIGYGYTSDVWPGRIITADEAELLLRSDIVKFEDCITDAVKVDLLQYEFDALVCLAFNIGRSAFKGSSLLRYLNIKDFPRAADEFKRWIHIGRAISDGLYRRRVRERHLFVTGEY